MDWRTRFRFAFALVALVTLGVSVAHADQIRSDGARIIENVFNGGLTYLRVREAPAPTGPYRDMVVLNPAPASGGTITLGYSATSVTTTPGLIRSGGAAGSVSLPSFSFDDDPDTGMFGSAGNTLNLVTGTQLGLTVTPTQDVLLPNGVLSQNGTGGDTPHDCTVQSSTNTSVDSQHSEACGAGEILTGGGCFTGSTSISITASFPSSATIWTCNSSASTSGLIAYAMCCSI